LQLHADASVEHGVIGRDQEAQSVLLPGFALSVAATLDAD
jgi:hypothetical protein